MSEHIMVNREGPYEPDVDIREDPIGALFEVFLAGRMPDGTPLTDQQVSGMGGGLYEEYLKSTRE